MLDTARALTPSDRDVLLSQATYHAEAGDTSAAVAAARQLLRFHPGDAAGQNLLLALSH